MKNILIASFAILTIMSCNKNADGNKASIKEQKEENMVVYIAADKSRAKVTFQKENEKETILIEANKKKFQLDKIEDKEGVTTYERNGVKAEVKGDSLYIIQDSIVIPLKKWITN